MLRCGFTIDSKLAEYTFLIWAIFSLLAFFSGLKFPFCLSTARSFIMSSVIVAAIIACPIWFN